MLPKNFAVITFKSELKENRVDCEHKFMNVKTNRNYLLDF